MSKAKQTTTVQSNDFAKLQTKFIENARVRAGQPENAKCKTIITDIKEFSDESFKRQLESCVNNGFITFDSLDSLADKIKITDKSNNGYVALKVINKITGVIYSLANKNKSDLNNYVNAVFLNMVKNQTLTNKSALITLSKDYEYVSTDKVQTIKKVVDVKASTSSTQVSQIKQVLRFLDLADIAKGKRDAELSFKDNAQSKAIIAFYQS
jgi:hypothetical protein